MRTRLLAPIVVLVLALAGAATAAAATGVFESNDSRLDTPHDIAERGTDVTTPSTSLPETTVPQATLPPTTLPGDDDVVDDRADEAGEAGEVRDERFVNFPAGTTQSFVAANAGTVTVRRDGGSLIVLAVNANPGWVTEVEQGAGIEVEVNFENGSARVDFNAELEDGAVRVRVRVRDDAVPDAPEVPGTMPPPPTAVDNSGPGNAHADNSGPGNANDAPRIEPGDDHGEDHDADHSGSSSSGSDSSGSGSGSSGSGHSGG